MKREKQLLVKLTLEEDVIVRKIRESGINISQFVRNTIVSYYSKNIETNFPNNFNETSLVLSCTG